MRISTSRRTGDDQALSVDLDGVTLSLSRAAALEMSEGEIETFIHDRGILTPVFVHRNRDGSFALAIGLEPDVWPEDEIKPPDVRDGVEPRGG